MTLDGPVAAEADDLAETLAAAVLAPRWLVTVSAPTREPARRTARRLAKLHDGAAYDPQEDAVFSPARDQPRRVPAAKPDRTSIVRLEWYVSADRWPTAPAALARDDRPPAARRRCPPGSATPSRCRSATRPMRSRPSRASRRRSGTPRAPRLGGHALPPHRLGSDFDWRVLEADPRWREAIVELFAAAAAAVGAFYAECWVEPGWNVSRTNRLSIGAGRKTRAPALGRDGWQGLPAEPAWLTWYGGEYRDPVGAALDGTPAPRRRLRKVEPAVDARPEGVLVRLGERPRAKLPPLPLPAELLRPPG